MELLWNIVVWLNSPWSKNYLFQPWSYDLWLNNGVSFFTFVSSMCFDLEFNNQWIHPIYELIPELPQALNFHSVKFGRVHNEQRKIARRELKNKFRGLPLQRALKDLERSEAM